MTRWSPDGSRIAFVSDDGSGMNVYWVPPTGGTRRRIAQTHLQHLDRFTSLGALGPGPALALAGAALLLVLPVSLNLLAERALRRVAELPPPGRFRMQRWPWITYLAGAVLVAAAGFCLALALGDWLVSAAIVAIVMVLILATVSNTHADIAVLLAVVALLATAPLETPIPGAATNQSGPGTLVALGDSYTSGEGAGTYYAGTDDAGANECRRSPSAYAPRLVFEEHRFERLAFLACSAARTYHVVASADADGQSQVQPGEAGTQIDQLAALTRRSGNPSLVVVGIGGNDAGFGTIAEICVAPGDCSSQRALLEHNLPSVRRALVATYTSIRKAVPGVPILAIPYPQPFADRRNCDGIALTKSERDFIRVFVDRLDDTVRVAAQQAGLRYVPDMRDALAASRLQLCDADKASAGLNFIDVRSVNGLATQRFNPARWLHNSLHPNEQGHAAMARTLADWLRRNGGALTTTAQAPAGSAGSAVDPDAVAEPEPPCSMTDSEGPSCQALAREWEIDQVRSVALWGAAAVLAALVLLWSAGVVLIGRLDAIRRGRR